MSHDMETQKQEFIQRRDANLSDIQAVMQVAHEMLKANIFSHEDISLVTGLSIEKIRELADAADSRS
jgi:hypothetical protein